VTAWARREPKAVERARWWCEILVIRGKSEVGSNTTISEDDSSTFEHVEAVCRRRRWTGLRELKRD
jgi:hypothetical protein